MLAILFTYYENYGLPHWVPVSIQMLGYLMIVVISVGWGRVRGFPVRTPEGHLSGENILRCLVMAFVMSFPIGLVTAGLTFMISRSIVWEWARHAWRI